MVAYRTEGSSALAPNDPYNDMDRSDIRPNFKVIEGGGQGDGKPTGNLKALAKNDLSKVEKSASTNPKSTVAGGADQAQLAEQNTFDNKVQGLNPKDKKGKGKGK